MRKSLKGILSITMLVFVPATVWSQSPQLRQTDPTITERIQSGELVGITLGYVSPEGDIFTLSKGSLTTDGNEKVDPNTIFEIGSITKVFTALALAVLIEETDISLDTEAEALLPDGYDLPTYEGQEIILRHLVTHTSGLPRLPDNFFPEDPSNPYADYTVSDLKTFLSEYELSRAPDAEFEYSNLGMALLGQILENQFGKSYEELIDERISQPLKMQNTSITLSKKDSLSLARGHSDGKEVSNWDLPSFAGAGALRSTANDMIKFLKAQMDLVSTDLYPAMTQTQRPLFDIRNDTTDTKTDKIGMGWFWAAGQDSIIWHSGGTGGYRSYAGFNTETGAGAVILSNTTADIGDLFFHLLDEDYPLKKSDSTITISGDQLLKYTGEYKAPSGISFYVTREKDQLYVRLTGQPKSPIYPTSETRFFYKIVPAEIQFYITEDDRVGKLTLYQNGQEISADKISSEISGEAVEHKEIEVDRSILEQYTGIYKLSSIPGQIRITLKEGPQLHSQITGQPTFPIFPEAKNKFFYKVVEAQIEFIRNDEGKYNSLKLYQTGQAYEGKKVGEVNNVSSI